MRGKRRATATGDDAGIGSVVVLVNHCPLPTFKRATFRDSPSPSPAILELLSAYGLSACVILSVLTFALAFSIIVS